MCERSQKIGDRHVRFPSSNAVVLPHHRRYDYESAFYQLTMGSIAFIPR